MKRISLYITLLLCTSLTFTSCTGNEGPDRESNESSNLVTMSIASRATAGTHAADGDNELINSWWMAFVAPDGTVVETLDRTEAYDPAGQKLPNSAVERETFNVSLADGTYKVYAFANFTGSSPSSNIWGIKKGEKMPDLSSSTWATGIDNDSNIPMTGFTTFTAPSPESENLIVEVVRMFAKLEFQFSTTDANSSNTAMKLRGVIKTLKRIKVHNAATSAVKLLPDYTKLEGGAPSLPADASNSDLEYTVDMPLNSSNTSFWQYIFESTAAAHPTGHYVLDFEIETVKDGTSSTETISALAYQLDHITRNDWIRIPVTFTDWTVRLDVRFYPPIGGYPAVVVDSKGHEFYAKFGSSGYFEIIPEVSDSNTGAVLNADKYTVAVTLESGSELFSRTPSWENGELVGELAEGKTGTAVIDLKITVKDDTLAQTFTRKLYIIRS